MQENPSSDSFYDSDNADQDVQSAQIAQQPDDDDDTSQMDSAQDSTDVDGLFLKIYENISIFQYLFKLQLLSNKNDRK